MVLPDDRCIPEYAGYDEGGLPETTVSLADGLVVPSPTLPFASATKVELEVMLVPLKKFIPFVT